jgi:hypothetical protein
MLHNCLKILGISNIAKQTQILHWLFVPTKLRKPNIKIPSEENLNDLELQTPNVLPKVFHTIKPQKAIFP